METCARSHGHWTDCHCPVTCCGGEEESLIYCDYDSKEVYEPADWVQQDVAPDYSTQPYLDIPRSLPEGAEIVVPKRYGFIFHKQEKSETHYAGMALPTNKNYDLSRERGLLIVDNGATRTLTRSLFNMSNVRKEIVKIQLAGDKMFIKSTHSGRKTHYALDATGTIRPITTEAFYVPDLDQDLLAGRALVQSKFRIVMDEDQSISGLFPVVNGQIDPATGFPFADSDGLFFIETVPISESKYLTMSGYKLWHHRLGHSTHQTIKDTIPHVKGLHELEKIRMEPRVDCPACMVGKAKLQPYPKTKDHAKRPLERVYVDLVSASVKSIEGYEYALIITDDATMYRWVYGLKTKDDANAAMRTWVSD